jgi:hypothetical protein
MKRRASRPVDTDQLMSNLANSPGYLVKVKCSHEDFLTIGKVVNAWDEARPLGVRYVRVCAYAGAREPVAVVSLYPSATSEALDALRGILRRWGQPDVAVVADHGKHEA